MSDNMLVLNNLRVASEAMASHIFELYEKISSLENDKNILVDAIVELSDVASACDSWKSFPQYALDDAMVAINRATMDRTNG